MLTLIPCICVSVVINSLSLSPIELRDTRNGRNLLLVLLLGAKLPKLHV
jgi:hypothetical protein